MKPMLYIGIGVGSFIGSYLPVLFGDSNFLSGWSIIGGLVGGLIGLFGGYKLAKALDG